MQILCSLKSFLLYAPQLSGASILYFHIPSFLRVHHQEWLQSDGCWIAGNSLLPWVHSGLTSSYWRAAVADDYDILAYWYGRKYSTSQYGFSMDTEGWIMFFFVGAVLCDAECLIASLASIQGPAGSPAGMTTKMSPHITKCPFSIFLISCQWWTLEIFHKEISTSHTSWVIRR